MDMKQYAGSESSYLRASDLQGTTPTVVISGVETVQFDDDEGGKETKPVLAFKGREKKLVLNKTNTEAIGGAFGWQSDDWIGKSIMLSIKHYKTFGREGIVATPRKDELDDEIPF